MHIQIQTYDFNGYCLEVNNNGMQERLIMDYNKCYYMIGLYLERSDCGSSITINCKDEWIGYGNCFFLCVFQLEDYLSILYNV